MDIQLVEARKLKKCQTNQADPSADHLFICALLSLYQEIVPSPSAVVISPIWDGVK
jgi:hypothetical protein